MKIEKWKLKIIKNYKAITLMELLLVIAIIGIMTTVGFVSLNSGKNTTKLQAAQREVASAIKLAQSYALQGKVDKETPPATPCGYGFRFIDSTHYEIFYNTWTTGGWDGIDNCARLNENAAPSYKHRWPGSPHSQIMESYQLNSGVTLSSPAAATDAEIYFTIPGGNIYDNTGAAYGGQMFTFSLGASDTKTITIDSGGSVTEN